MRAVVIGFAIAAGVCLLPDQSVAQSGTAYFKDKTVTYVVATSAGGGYDVYGRLVAR